MPLTAIKLDPAVPDVPPRSAGTGGEAVREVVRYLAASVAALSLDAALLWAGVERVGLPVWLAGSVAYLAGLVLIYVLSVRWVFARRAFRDARDEFVLFAALGLLGLMLNALTLFVGTALGLALPLAKAASAGIGFTANFVTRKVLLFSVAKP